MIVSNPIAVRLERIPVSRWHVRARLVIGLATLFDGIDTLSIAYVLPVLVAAWHLSHQQTALLISSGYAGQLIGGIISGGLADRIGRKPTLLLTVALYGISSFLCALAWNYPSLLVLRVVQGFGLGGEVPVAAAYVNELARAKGRGRFFLLYEQAYSGGRLCAAVLGVWVVGHLGWRYLFLVGGFPALLALWLRRELPESPRWLWSKGKFEQAERAMGEIETVAMFRPVQSCDETLKPASPPLAETYSWKELFQPPYLGRTLVTWVIWFVTFMLLNGLGNWVPTLYTSIFHLPLQTALRYGAVSSLTGFSGCLVVALLIEYTGRRRWYVGAFCGAALACLVLWLSGARSAAAVLVCTSATAFFVNSIAMVVFLHTPEIYPTRIRALATCLASAWLRVASILAPLFIAFTLGRGSLAGVFLVFAVACVFAALISARFAIETRDRVLEEIAG